MATARQQAAARTRTALLESGLALADRNGLANLSINLLVAEAGVSKGTFFHHFASREQYLLAIHREFHDRVFAEIEAAIAGIEPGRDRLLAAATAYMDACLRHAGIRALLLEARAEPAILDAVRARNETAAAVCAADFAALGHRHPLISARLWIPHTVEAALLEHAAGRHCPEVRESLAEFLGGAGPGGR